MINMQAWMFQSSFEKFRSKLLSDQTILAMIHLGERAFDSIGGAVVSTTAFVIQNRRCKSFRGVFARLVKGGSEKEKSEMLRAAIAGDLSDLLYRASGSDFEAIPGEPIAYWASSGLKSVFESQISLTEYGRPRQGLASTNNEMFYRFWHEVSTPLISFKVASKEEAKKINGKWFPLNKGGGFRRWFGNNDYIINFENQGKTICNYIDNTPGARVGSNGRVINREFYFKPGITYSDLTTGGFGSRRFYEGFIFDTTGPSIFEEGVRNIDELLVFSNTKVFQSVLDTVCPGLHYSNGVLAKLPAVFPQNERRRLLDSGSRLILLSKSDWDAYETSWDFTTLPLLSPEHRGETLENSYATLRAHWQDMTDEMQRLEEENNRIFIDAYGLQDELTPEVPVEEITLTCNPAYRYGVKGTQEQREERLRLNTLKELISYAIGCMMGRYSLAEPGLIYANAGNEGFDTSRYGDFPADDDGIVPITEVEWFDDDAALRFEEFLRVAWSPETLRDNLRFVAESLAANGGNDPQKTIRNYISRSFFKDHMQTYKKRPIYWLFSSGKLGAFECLVYLHRYNESTLSRMRMEYVTPLTSRMAARIDQLENDITNASSSAARNKAQKEKDLMVKQLEELRAFDEELRHYADQRISLDLDDGVKVNYGKFGNLLAERKAITGEKG